MANSYDITFTQSHSLLPDGAVAFRCAQDRLAWPWLALPATHPLVLQSLNYWASVETGRTRGTLDPTKWSALTYSRWDCAPGVSGPITCGLADHPGDAFAGDTPAFRLTFFDSDGRFVCRLVGTGVVFRTRDFDRWRDRSRSEVRAQEHRADLVYAPPEALGVERPVECFVAPLGADSPAASAALVTRANGLMPRHPYHGGSGDHVNANHLADVGFQFAHLLHAGQTLHCTAGEMTFLSYVELDRVFTLTQRPNAQADGAVCIEVAQRGKVCTMIKLWVDPVSSDHTGT